MSNTVSFIESMQGVRSLTTINDRKVDEVASDRITIYESDANEATFLAGSSDFVVVLFLPRSAMPIEKNGNVPFFRKRNINLVVLRSKKNLWWMDVDFQKCRSEVVEFLKDREFSERIGYAISMGTFGAISHWHDLGLDRLILYAPVANLDPRFETRWLDDYIHLLESPQHAKPKVRSVKLECPSVIIYDPFDTDAAHVKLLTGPSLQEIRVKRGGHGVVEWLKDLGLLSQVGNDLLYGLRSSGEIQETINMAMRSDAGYILKVLKKNSKRPRQSITVLRTLLKRDPKNIAALCFYSVCLSRTQQFSDALRTINSIPGIFDEAFDHAGFIMALTVFLRQGGDGSWISGHINRAIASHSDGFETLLWKVRILRFQERFDDATNLIAKVQVPEIKSKLSELESHSLTRRRRF